MKKMRLTEDDLLISRRRGTVHDIGKSAIDESILRKPGKLTKEEYEIIKTHPEIGESICAPLKTLQPILPTTLYHQERFNGSGYPEGLKGKDIPIHARIIGVVDCYDALTTKRPYREALSGENAKQIIKKETAEGLWDPEIIKIFFDMMAEKDFTD